MTNPHQKNPFDHRVSGFPLLFESAIRNPRCVCIRKSWKSLRISKSPHASQNLENSFPKGALLFLHSTARNDKTNVNTLRGWLGQWVCRKMNLIGRFGARNNCVPVPYPGSRIVYRKSIVRMSYMSAQPKSKPRGLWFDEAKSNMKNKALWSLTKNMLKAKNQKALAFQKSKYKRKPSDHNIPPMIISAWVTNLQASLPQCLSLEVRGSRPDAGSPKRWLLRTKLASIWACFKLRKKEEKTPILESPWSDFFKIHGIFF